MHRGTDIARALRVLADGGLVAFPTETVYGLGADATRESAIAAIYAAKGRPTHHPLIVHLPDASALDAWAADVPERARALAARAWPGPLTMILRRGPRVLPAVTGGADTIGLRVPSHPLAAELLAGFGGAIAAPSANRFGRVSPTTADHVEADLAAVAGYLLDGGPCPVGVESTIVDLSRDRPTLLRPGGLPRAELERMLGCELLGADERSPRTPGLLPSHYAPAARLVAVDAGGLAAAVAVAEPPVAVLGRTRDLAAVALPLTTEVVAMTDDLERYAHDLYAVLRDLDRRSFATIVAVLPPRRGLGEAIADRLRRAAAPRPDRP